MLTTETEMLAFTNTEVDKATLMQVLEEHAAADRIMRGHYWRDDAADGIEYGCAVGCSIHNFRPGEEDVHFRYEELFGIPEDIARIEDDLFETMYEGWRTWPVRFVAAIPVGADLTGVARAWAGAVRSLTGWDGGEGLAEESRWRVGELHPLHPLNPVDVASYLRDAARNGEGDVLMVEQASDALIELLRGAPVGRTS